MPSAPSRMVNFRPIPHTSLSGNIFKIFSRCASSSIQQTPFALATFLATTLATLVKVLVLPIPTRTGMPMSR